MEQPYAPSPPIIDLNPSPWWSWGVAIFLGIMVALAALGALALALIPYDYIATEYTWAEDPGEYPANGSKEEQDGWNESNEQWELQQLTQTLLYEMEEEVPLQLTLFAGVTLVGIGAMILLARQNPNGFKLAYVWLLFSTSSNIYSTLRYNALMSDLAQFFPEEAVSGTYQVAASIGGTLACNLTVLAVLITCAVNSQPKHLEESGFHLYHPPPSSSLQPPPKD
ncbi:MAG: hypothetical protein P8Q85_05935 [Candidatus Poseidoniaceae archaeon]|nr:hypothetical protein [Candidatus Poseidoniaceae archaeon]MDG1557672.1 hypothetical protein [Candidatus Poseidoniaceae archaeon]MDG1559501.1 hypothetical protein [Candidatus Poseidoniaceae archaeon]